MRHLYSSVVRIESMQLVVVNGEATSTWAVAPEEGADWVECRLDLNFLRPGKDAPAPINAGVVADRVGIMFCDADAPLKPERRIVTIPNSYGEEPVKGTFEIKAIPDVALDYSSAHHIEVQIIESVQQFGDGNFGDPEEAQDDSDS